MGNNYNHLSHIVPNIVLISWCLAPKNISIPCPHILIQTLALWMGMPERAPHIPSRRDYFCHINICPEDTKLRALIYPCTQVGHHPLPPSI